MTNYTPPRGGQDLNHLMASPSLTAPQYAENDTANYNYSPHPHCEKPATNYSTYMTSFISSQAQATQYLPENLQMAPQYPYDASLFMGTATHQRPLSQATPYSFQQISHHSLPPSSRYVHGHDHYQLADIESQESVNENTMLSEPVLPPLDGFPNIRDFDRLIHCYVDGLSSKKQDKALIHAKRARNIKAVLIDKKTTAVESAQFRFWVKKMFTLSPSDSKTSDRKKQICHEGKPVAVREKLFKILTKAHKQCQHGGRDKTSAQVRRVYSWVPKELISRFVKLCPTCKARRGSSSHVSPPTSPKDGSSVYTPPQSPEIPSPPAPRRDPMLSRRSSTFSLSPVGINTYGAQYQGHQWLSSSQHIQQPLSNPSEPAHRIVSNNMMANMSQHGLSMGHSTPRLQDSAIGSHRSYQNHIGTNTVYSQQQHQY